ncbi:MAG: ATP-binding protein [Kineosporiaceae bacterium]|nr:ATP-binding protein [Kineosporiaceae bacterium]
MVIEGARQVGKSTFADMITAGRPRTMVTLADSVVLTAARACRRLRGAVDRFILVIDEIQRVPELIPAIKAAVDRRRDPGRFVLTGSSDLLRLERTPDSLAGRAVTVHLFPLSQGELAGIPASSIINYADTLRTLFLVMMIEPWTPNLTRCEVSRPKAVVVDPGLAMRLAGLTAAGLVPITGGEHLGAQLEGFIASELLRQQGWSSTGYRLTHYRDRNGLEVDLVLELDDGRIIAVEVKASASVRPEDLRGLAALRDRVGDRFIRGALVHLGERVLPLGDRLISLPVQQLWGHAL